MGIRVKGANKRYTTAMMLEAAVGMIDTQNRVVEFVTLIWNNHKQNATHTKTKGFEDTFIERGSNGLVITSRLPGSAEWIKDGITGQYVARLQKTPHNMKVLAHNHYDLLWIVKEAHIRAEVILAADAIDEESKSYSCTSTVVRKTVNPKTQQYETKEEEITETLFDFNVRRRAAHFKSRDESDIRRLSGFQQQENTHITKEAELNAREMKLNEREANLKNQETSAAQTPVNISGKQEELMTVEALKKMHPQTIKKMAREMFSKTDKELPSKIEEIREMILEKNSLSKKGFYSPKTDPIIKTDINQSPIERVPEIVTG